PLERRFEVVSTAYRHRDRLTLQERLMTEGVYFVYGPEPDYDRALEAYDRLLREDSMNVAALNNAATLLIERGETARAEEYYVRATASPVANANVYQNALRQQVRNRRPAAVMDSTLAEYRSRFPDHLGLGSIDMMVAWNTGRYERVDSIARAEFASPRSENMRINSMFALGEVASLRGQPDAAYRWYREYYSELNSARSSEFRVLEAVADTAYHLGVLVGDVVAARAVLNRAVARTPIEEVPRGERPWLTFLYLASDLQDSALANSIAPSYMRDVNYLARDSAAAHVHTAALVAMASERWNEAIPLLHAARQASVMDEADYQRFVATAHDAAGSPDSAIVWFERFIVEPDPEMTHLSAHLPRVHRRLGELYEERGDSERAASHYSTFINYWRDAEPSLQPEVAEARRRLARLTERSG